MQSIRIYEMPAGKMVSSPVGMFGQESFDAFGIWMEQQPREMLPRDFLMWDAHEQGFRWLYLYEPGMNVPKPLEVIDFQGGLYAVATDVDQQTDKQAMDAQVEAFLEANHLQRDHSRLEMGNIITSPAVRSLLGYEQMDYYYPVKCK